MEPGWLGRTEERILPLNQQNGRGNNDNKHDERDGLHAPPFDHAGLFLLHGQNHL